MKYKFEGEVTVSIYTEVEADTEKEALEIAENRCDIEQYHFGDVNACVNIWVNDQYDGEPTNIHITD